MVLSRALALVWRGNSTEGGGTNTASVSHQCHRAERTAAHTQLPSPRLSIIHSFHYTQAMSGLSPSDDEGIDTTTRAGTREANGAG